jgi:hypothetical protein
MRQQQEQTHAWTPKDAYFDSIVDEQQLVSSDSGGCVDDDDDDGDM